MTDKEQIMIDGVDVSKCRYFRPGSALTCSRMYGGACDNKYSNELCYFKQLAHKTRECEELKKQLETSEEWQIKAESLNEKLELRNTRYRKALEEIEGMLQVIVESNKVYPLRSNLYKILDIIRKAKGEEE